MIEELNPSGTKERGFIYAGEKQIGYSWGSGNVSLQYEDPSGLTVRASSPQSDLATYWAELDPWGAEVLTFDPYVSEPQFSGGRGEGGPVFPGFGDISLPSQGCTQLLDGVLSLCDFATRNMNGGGILVERLTRTGTRQLLPLNLYLGATWIWREGRSGTSSMQIDYDEDGTGVIRTNNSFPGYWELIEFIVDGQKPDPETIPGRGNTKDCSLMVSFKPGDFGGIQGFPLGPSQRYDTDLNKTIYGLGFMVKVTVPKGDAVSTMGDDSVPSNAKGNWTVDQWTSSWATYNGNFLKDKTGRIANGGPAVRDINILSPSLQDGSEFSWYDHVGNSFEKGSYGNWEILVKAYRGRKYCEARFWVTLREDGSVHWGERKLPR